MSQVRVIGEHRSAFYAIPALIAATITVIASRTGTYGIATAAEPHINGRPKAVYSTR